MQRKTASKTISTEYLKNTEKGFPKQIFWKKVAGPELDPIQMYDIVYDEYDLKIRTAF